MPPLSLAIATAIASQESSDPCDAIATQLGRFFVRLERVGRPKYVTMRRMRHQISDERSGASVSGSYVDSAAIVQIFRLTFPLCCRHKQHIGYSLPSSGLISSNPNQKSSTSSTSTICSDVKLPNLPKSFARGIVITLYVSKPPSRRKLILI